MSFEIDARIENGAPQLHILDADSRCVRLAWHCPHAADPGSPEARAVQQLFKELFLLVLGERLHQDAAARLSAPETPADKCRH